MTFGDTIIIFCIALGLIHLWIYWPQQHKEHTTIFEIWEVTFIYSRWHPHPTFKVEFELTEEELSGAIEEYVERRNAMARLSGIPDNQIKYVSKEKIPHSHARKILQT